MLVFMIAIFLLLMMPRARGYGSPFVLDGRDVVVTGAASGIGRELCFQLSRRFSGCHIHMIDINNAGLRDSRDAILKEGSSTQVSNHHCDITDLPAFEKVLASISESSKSSGRHVSVLVNNAGIVHGKSWEDLSIAEFQATVTLASSSQFAAIKSFLPAMLEHNDGMIVTLASLMSVLPGCQLSDYCAAKHATLGLHNSIRLELSCRRGNKVKMLSVLPYVVDTGMFHGAFQAPSLWMTRLLFPPLKTSDSVDRILVGVSRSEMEIFLPRILTFAAQLSTVLPIPIFQSLIKYAGAADGMKTFQGNKFFPK